MTGVPDFAGDEYAVTQSLVCEQHPPAEDWPDRSLILGQCPHCGSGGIVTGVQAARLLKARRLGQQTLQLGDE